MLIGTNILNRGKFKIFPRLANVTQKLKKQQDDSDSRQAITDLTKMHQNAASNKDFSLYFALNGPQSRAVLVVEELPRNTIALLAVQNTYIAITERKNNKIAAQSVTSKAVAKGSIFGKEYKELRTQKEKGKAIGLVISESHYSEEGKPSDALVAALDLIYQELEIALNGVKRQARPKKIVSAIKKEPPKKEVAPPSKPRIRPLSAPDIVVPVMPSSVRVEESVFPPEVTDVALVEQIPASFPESSPAEKNSAPPTVEAAPPARRLEEAQENILDLTNDDWLAKKVDLKNYFGASEEINDLPPAYLVCVIWGGQTHFIRKDERQETLSMQAIEVPVSAVFKKPALFKTNAETIGQAVSNRRIGINPKYSESNELPEALDTVRRFIQDLPHR